VDEGGLPHRLLLRNEAVIDVSFLEGKTIIFTINEIMDVKLLQHDASYILGIRQVLLPS